MFSEYFLIIATQSAMPGYSLIVFSISPSSIAQSPYLDLVILSAQIFDVPVRQPSGDISCAVNSFTRSGRIVDELLIGQRRVIQVAPGQTDPGNTQLSGLTDSRLSAVSDNVQPDVMNRLPDRNVSKSLCAGHSKQLTSTVASVGP